MNGPGLTTDEIRQAVAIYLPHRLELYDKLTAAPTIVAGVPIAWTDALRVEFLLWAWPFDPTRPN